MFIFLFKLAFVPLLIGLVSLAGRVWGAAIGGWLAALPIIAGPLIFFLALEQGAAFAGEAAHNTLTGLISLTAYCLTYSRLSLKVKWPLALLSGWLAFFICTFLLNLIRLPLLASFGAAVVLLVVALRLFPQAPSPSPPVTFPQAEILARMIAATFLVAILTVVAHSLGPRLSGLLTPFPIVATVLAVFTHHSWGGAATIQLLRGLVTGLFTFAVFFLVVAAIITNHSLGFTFALASLIALIVHGGLLGVVRRYLAHSG